MKTNIVHDKLLPWRLAQARKAVVEPFKAVSEGFQAYLNTFWNTWAAVFTPQGANRERNTK